MKNIVFIASMLISSHCFADAYKCLFENGEVTYSNRPMLDCEGGDTPLNLKSSPSVEEQPKLSREIEIARTEKYKLRKLFLDELKVGDLTFLGLVVQVKRPIAQIQTKEALMWYRIDHLFPADYFEK